MRKDQKSSLPSVISSDEELARYGLGRLAYTKVISLEDAKKLFPEMKNELPTWQKMHAMWAADGTPLSISDSKKAMQSAAFQRNLEFAALH